VSNHSLMIFFTILIAWFVLRHFYRNSVHPYFMDRARFQVFAIRDELRQIQMSRRFSKNEARSIAFMEQALNGAVKHCAIFRLGEFLADSISPPSKVDLEQLKRFEEFRKYLPEELTHLDARFGRAAGMMMIANSPLLVVFMFLWYAPQFLIQRALGKSSGWKKMRRGFASFAHVAPCQNA
jgi:hypothetical protein